MRVIMSISDENQFLYTESPGLDPDRKALIKKWINNLDRKPSKSLDVGCGSGSLSLLLGENVEKWGLDFQRNSLLPDHFKFIAGDVSEEWHIPKEAFDIVFAGEIIEHLLDTDKFLCKCFEALSPDGILILTTPNLSSFANLRYWLRTENYMWVDSGANQFGHVRYLAPQRLRLALMDAGFVRVHLQTVSGLETLGFFPPLLKFTRSLFPLRGNRLCALAFKP